MQMGRYLVASWLSIVLQFVSTKFAARIVHYMVANVIAIVLAAIVTYLLNDVWTFGLKTETAADEASSGKG
jgi:dolichol-phosphate mannosyltransferase